MAGRAWWAPFAQQRFCAAVSAQRASRSSPLQANPPLPSVNRYQWSANLNFGYVPFYGKFALFDRWIFQWEGYVQAGLGVIQTEWITRDPADRKATNYDIQWHVDIGTRLFLTKWLAIHAYLKDYMFVDSLEPASRGSAVGSAPPPKGDSNFIQNIVFCVGV